MRLNVLRVAGLTLLFLSGILSDPSNEAAGVKPRRFRKVLVRRTPVLRGTAAGGPEAPSLEDEGPTRQASRQSRSTPPRSRAQDDDSDDYDGEASAPQTINRIPGLPPGAKIEQIFRLPAWVDKAIKLNVPVSGDPHHKLTPIILLPIPVPSNDNSKCSADNRLGQNNPELDYQNRDQRPNPRRPETYNDGLEYTGHKVTPASRKKPSRPAVNDNDDYDDPAPVAAPQRKPARPVPSGDDYDEPAPAPRPKPSRPAYDDDYIDPATPASRTKPSRPFAYDNDYNEPATPAPRPKPLRPVAFNNEPPTGFSRPSRPQSSPVQVGSFRFDRVSNAPEPPVLGENVPSNVLIELFRAQQPRSPHLPPVLIRERRHSVEEHPTPVASKPLLKDSGLVPSLEVSGPLENGYPYPIKYLPPTGPEPEGRAEAKAGVRSNLPSPPRFDRPLTVRGSLTVPRAEYTESYIAKWDATSGAAHVEMFDSASTMYRMVAGNQATRAVVKLDRTGETVKKRCIVMPQSRLTPEDRIPPVLPDPKDFTFKGHVQYGDVKAEMWKRTLSGGAGELGAAPAEKLTFRHALVVRRAEDTDSAMPLMYSVAVDSSVLGPDSDGYTHRYHEVREGPIDRQALQIDLESSCDKMEEAKDMMQVEPLLEFTMPTRHPQHAVRFQEYTSQYNRRYSDSAEEAMRMNVFVQSSRFVAAAGRVGAAFAPTLNFLSDRLQLELTRLMGVALGGEHVPADPYPYSRPQLRTLTRKLPNEFDWRERGAVSPVQYQGTMCASCWAFAVAGAVEGALFRRTRTLVPLSMQTLVDCAHPFGANGCNGTWPSHAYEYVRERGLPALADYPYEAEVQKCQDKPPVTHIKSHVNVEPHSVPALKVAIRRHAPTVVIIDANNCPSFITYKAGVFYDDRCGKVKEKLNHAVLAVGWGEENGESHFILKNSWSAKWGEDGYIRVHGESNTCGVLALPSYPRLDADDVDAPDLAQRRTD